MDKMSKQHDAKDVNRAPSGVKRSRSESDDDSALMVREQLKQLDLAYQSSIRHGKERYDGRIDALLLRSCTMTSADYRDALTALMKIEKKKARDLETEYNAMIARYG